MIPKDLFKRLLLSLGVKRMCHRCLHAVVLCMLVRTILADEKPLGILQRAQQALMERQNIACEDTSRLRVLRDDATHTEGSSIVSHGRFIMSEGRYRREIHVANYDADGSGPFLERTWTDVFDGAKAQGLRERDNTYFGFIESEPGGFSQEDGIWLLTGWLYGASEAREGVPRKTVFQYLMEDVPSDRLKRREVTTSDGRSVVSVSGVLPWGWCEVWIDPKRDYNLVKLVAELSPVPVLGASWQRYETDEVELVRLDGRWMPTRVQMQWHTQFDPEPGGDGQPVTIINSYESELTHLRLLSQPEPDETFQIQWPKGTKIRNRILGITYYHGQAESHPLDVMVDHIFSLRQSKPTPHLELLSHTDVTTRPAEHVKQEPAPCPAPASLPHSHARMGRWGWMVLLGLAAIVLGGLVKRARRERKA